MSELFMECEEEELEPWQRRIPEINLIDDDDDDDDEPIFVGEIRSSKPAPNSRPIPANQRNQQNVRPPVQIQRAVASTMTSPQKPVQITPSHPQPNLTKFSTVPQLTLRGASQPVTNSVLIPVSSQSGSQQTGSRTLTPMSPQPIIINNQGYIVASPQVSNNSAFINSLGSQYPPGTSITVLPAGQQVLQQVTPPKPVPGVIHRPQVQLIQNNVVTLSNVQGPPDMPAPVLSSPIRKSIQIVPPQITQTKSNITPVSMPKPISSSQPAIGNRDNGAVKRTPPDSQNNAPKRVKISMENGTPFRKRCPKCQVQFLLQDPLKSHMRLCCPHLIESVFPSTSKSDRPAAPSRMYDHETGKLIMLVSDFYYGKFEGNKPSSQEQKTSTTFKCNSCLKILKNNIRFMNHMKHHLELEKQNSESWESHTTCQHCYRQYSTPFQLQCHIESAHSPYESTTNCKICELAFESEQVLLEHMRDNHKPGEMPYVCQVCNYRSSFFTDVETHFRSVHENTKDLLCPFCLKVLRSGHMYMQHYMRHQKKGIHRCGKCRLNFLTYKEKVEHKTAFHRTFKKPKCLEGLPPGTKVTIRASLTGGSPVSSSLPITTVVAPSCPSTKPAAKAPTTPVKPKSSGSQSPTGGKSRNSTQTKRGSQTHNYALKMLKFASGTHICVECSSEVKDPFAHFPIQLKCGACKYRTSCQKSYAQHMIRFHSLVSKKRFRKAKTLQNITLVCLNCDFLVDFQNSDLMTKHLIDRPNHNCQIIFEKGNKCEEEPISCDTDENKDGNDDQKIELEGLTEDLNTPSSSSEAKELPAEGLPAKSDPEDSEINEPAPESKSSERSEENTTQDLDETAASNTSCPAEESQVQTDQNKENPESSQNKPKNGLSEESPSGTPSPSGAGEPSSPSKEETKADEARFDEFLSKSDNTETVSSDICEQNTSQLEPLTPSNILEHEATGILQENTNSSSPSNLLDSLSSK
ncbi:zinc finger protein 280C [Chanos chanos]|uniref:Zinc finger protein 280C n=1 Tax=Chanos chanos TaxID=29144 RepID=A0A6J2UQA1_CHACN|nr:zinc finger protein 280D [Chanos chanos]